MIGGWGKTICLPPQYFHLGATAPLPPRIDASAYAHEIFFPEEDKIVKHNKIYI